MFRSGRYIKRKSILYFLENDILINVIKVVARSVFWRLGNIFLVSLLSFTSSEVDELEKWNCSVKLGISSFVSMIELNVNGLLSRQRFLCSHLKWCSSQSHWAYLFYNTSCHSHGANCIKLFLQFRDKDPCVRTVLTFDWQWYHIHRNLIARCFKPFHRRQILIFYL